MCWMHEMWYGCNHQRKRYEPCGYKTWDDVGREGEIQPICLNGIRAHPTFHRNSSKCCCRDCCMTLIEPFFNGWATAVKDAGGKSLQDSRMAGDRAKGQFERHNNNCQRQMSLPEMRDQAMMRQGYPNNFPTTVC